MLLLHAISSCSSLHVPTLQPSQLAPLFGAEQFTTVPGFLAPSLVEALALDVESLRKKLQPSRAAPQFGSVEWLELRPVAPPCHDADDSFGVEGRECLLRFVDELQHRIETETGVALDAHVELKYACYPCGGKYQRHVDGMNIGSVAREYSFLLYLNEGWAASDGGHLRVFNLGGAESHVDIAPTAGTLVVFKSDIVPHEVRPTTSRRLAIVGWFHRHQEPPAEAEDNDLTPLARAIREHYRSQGTAIKLEDGRG